MYGSSSELACAESTRLVGLQQRPSLKGVSHRSSDVTHGNCLNCANLDGAQKDDVPGLLPVRAAALKELNSVLSAVHEQVPQCSLKQVAVERDACARIAELRA